MATLAAKILALNDGKKSTREIAEAVYGEATEPKHLSYVRIVLRQRKGRSASKNDRRYESSPLGRATRCESSRRHYRKPERRAYVLAYKKVLRATGSNAKARIAANRAKERVALSRPHSDRTSLQGEMR